MYLTKQNLSDVAEPVELIQFTTPAAIPVPPPYKRQYHTTAHMVLDLESEVKNVPDCCYQVLDAVIKEASDRISVVGPSDTAQGLAALNTIEDVLLKHNFVCSIPIFLVDTLTDALSARQIDKSVINTDENANRKQHIQQHINEDFHHGDCDTFSLIYLAIGEILGLPIRMVEVPKHNFVRWLLDSSNYINWETNFGASKYTDDDYRRSKHLSTTKYVLSLMSIISGAYLRSMDNHEALGYFLSLRGGSFANNETYTRAIEDNTHALFYSPRCPVVWNNVAWSYVSTPGLEYRNREVKAVELAVKAASVFRDPNVLDTLATAYAAAGDFAKAIEIETEAYNETGNPGYKHMIQVFQQNKTYIKHHYEKQEVFRKIKSAGIQGITHSDLLAAVQFSDAELMVIIEGLLLDRKIRIQQVEGQNMYFPQP